MTEHPVKRRKKMIEVAIPLEAINAASAREKSIRHGHPSTLQLWWAPRPLAATRAVIFCQMVDDPSSIPEEFPTKQEQDNERKRLFDLLERLVAWEAINDRSILYEAHNEIKRSWERACADNSLTHSAESLFNQSCLPSLHDPFAGGGAIPIEAQRLGINAFASDLNPLPVLINRSKIELNHTFNGYPPVNTGAESTHLVEAWQGAMGLSEDLKFYGDLLRKKAHAQLQDLYPNVLIDEELLLKSHESRDDLGKYLGKFLTPMCWVYARTVPSPNPAFSGNRVPLISSYILCPMEGKETIVEPVVEGKNVKFSVKRVTKGELARYKDGNKVGRKSSFRCIYSGDLIDDKYIKRVSKSGDMGYTMIAMILEGEREKVYIDPIEKHALIEKSVQRPKILTQAMNTESKDLVSGRGYGFYSWGDLFTSRQLYALNTFSELVPEVSQIAREDAKKSASKKWQTAILSQPDIADEYAKAISLYLGFLVCKLADRGSTLCTWNAGPSSNKNSAGRSAPAATIRVTFARQALAMSWDFVESNFFSESAGSIAASLKTMAAAISNLPNSQASGTSLQRDAATQSITAGKVVSTDPPYFNNIAYADLSDFFYVWLRHTLKNIFPDLLSTMLSPKVEELVASPHRHGGKEGADVFFLTGMTRAMERISAQAHPAFPITIYYAFKQAEVKGDEGLASTGWETFLEAVISSGLVVQGTWPIRTERSNRMVGTGQNALASSIVLVCQMKDPASLPISRSDFRRLLRSRIPGALKSLEQANIAPVDIAQAAIGPGMEIFSQAKCIMNPDDSRMSVRAALVEINTALDEFLSQDESELDAESRFALTFFESYGYEERPYGDAEGLAIARNLSVDGVAASGILRSVAGKVKLLQRSELEDDWDPARDKRLCIWEATQQMISRLEAHGEGAAASLLSQLKQISGHGDLAANCRALSYRLYNHCEKTKQAEEARAYNGLVIAWPELERLASNQRTETTVQASLI
jgi:putative DNA methylase